MHQLPFFISGGGRRATRITICIAVSIWIVAIICALPAALASHIKGIPEENSQFFVCYPFPHWLNDSYPQVMVGSKFLILYVIPLTIIAIFYLSMAASLIMSTRNVPGEMQGMHRQVCNKYYITSWVKRNFNCYIQIYFF